MPIHEQVIEAFSHSIYAKINLYRSNVLDDKGSRRLLESISFDIRKFSDLLIPRYSKAAQEKASSFGVVLSDISWHDQTKFDKEGRYSIMSISSRYLRFEPYALKVIAKKR
jgi:hypothetical protein